MEQDDWQTEHFNNRRIGHGRKGKGSTKGGVFDPRRSYGIYQLQCPALAKLPSSRKSAVRKKDDIATLEIHGPVEGRDDALVCSLELPSVLSGLAVLAGSRKVLSSVVQDLEHPDSEEDDEEEESNQEDGSAQSDDAEHSGEEERVPKSSIELADEKERRRYTAFEKNSFRSPKFWMRWRAIVCDTGEEDGQASETEIQAAVDSRPPETPSHRKSVEVNGGYLVFSGNDCASFNGTISCTAFDWKNVKFSGSKIVSKARDCPRGWTNIVVEEP